MVERSSSGKVTPGVEESTVTLAAVKGPVPVLRRRTVSTPRSLASRMPS